MCVSHLFNVDEVSGLKSDSVAWDGNVVIVSWSIREVATHSKRHGFVLQTQFKSFPKGSLTDVRRNKELILISLF